MDNSMDQRKNVFAPVILIMGILSCLTICTGIIPLFTGSLGVIFFLIGHRKQGPLSAVELIGASICVSCLIVCTLLLIYTMIAIVIPILTDPAAYEQWDAYYRSTLGISLDDLLGGY